MFLLCHPRKKREFSISVAMLRASEDKRKLVFILSSVSNFADVHLCQEIAADFYRMPRDRCLEKRLTMLRASEDKRKLVFILSSVSNFADVHLCQEIATDFYRMPETVSLKTSAKVYIKFEKSLNNL